jgi:hypothetical protein
MVNALFGVLLLFNFYVKETLERCHCFAIFQMNHLIFFFFFFHSVDVFVKKKNDGQCPYLKHYGHLIFTRKKI